GETLTAALFSLSFAKNGDLLLSNPLSSRPPSATQIWSGILIEAELSREVDGTQASHREKKKLFRF
ncbi:unnamed protein product, partial [Linum tenue]